jgi:hypothetical protein
MSNINGVGLCHPECPFCARAFWAWVKSRMVAMSRVRRGDNQSFAEAAASSVKV